MVSDEFALIESFKKKSDRPWNGIFLRQRFFSPEFTQDLWQKKNEKPIPINPMNLAVFLAMRPFSNGSKQQYKDQSDVLQPSVESKTFSKLP